MTAPTFPPLMQGEAVVDDPLDHAVARAKAGCDAGLIAYRVGTDDLDAALVLAPEVPMADAALMLPLCGVGLQNALGALAPPEVAVHLGWSGAILVNGAHCGALRLAAPVAEPDARPDWLIVALSLAFRPAGDAPGHAPDRTALHAEGCGEVTPFGLLSSWSRHTLNWIDRWEREGAGPLHTEYSGLVDGLGKPVEGGTFLGLDAQLGMLLKTDSGTRLVPLTTLVEVR